jgi:anti-anti-sigma regulatory factor/HAMP domain-containing protein
MFRTIRFRLISLLVVVSVLPLLLVGVLIAGQIFAREQEFAQSLQQEISTRAAVQITTFVATADNELRSIIQTPNFKNADRNRQESVLSQAIFFQTIFEELTLVDGYGDEQARVSRLGVFPDESLRNRQQETLFQQPIETNKTYFGEVYLAPLTGEPLLVVAVPTLDALSGTPDGVLIGAIRLRQVLEQVTSTQSDARSTISVAAENGTLIAHRDPQLLAQGPQVAVEAGTDTGTGSDGREALITMYPVSLGNLQLYVITEVPLSIVLAPLLETIGVLALIVVLIAGVAMGIGIGAVNQIVRPISALAGAARTVSHGDLTAQLPADRRDELGALQQDFNSMVDSLRTQQAAIAERNQELETNLATQAQLVETVTRLSVPMLPVWEGVVVLPLVGHIDQDRGRRLISGLLQGIAQRRTRVTIIDITGVAEVSSEVVNVLLEAAQSALLLGSRVLLVGISAKAALQIVQSENRLANLEIHRDLQTAIEAAIRR